MQQLTADDLLLLLLHLLLFSKIFKLRVVEESSGLERDWVFKGDLVVGCVDWENVVVYRDWMEQREDWWTTLIWLQGQAQEV
jgi:hypothetical protein